jgi:isopenicillin N synthase-like dioxygenase
VNEEQGRNKTERPNLPPKLIPLRMLCIGTDKLHEMSQNFMLRVNYHPAVPLKKDQIRHPLHQDFTLFTLVCATKCAGPSLQLFIDEEYLNVDASPEYLWVQTGKVLEYLTNGHVPATLHRVIGSYEEIPTERVSLAYLTYPNFDHTVAPLPNYVLEGEEELPTVLWDEVVNKQTASSVRSTK